MAIRLKSKMDNINQLFSADATIQGEPSLYNTCFDYDDKK